MTNLLPSKSRTDKSLQNILSNQKLTDPVKDHKAFTRGCLFILRALLNLPFTEDFPSSESNLFFFKVYNAKKYVYFVKFWMLVIVAIPLLESSGLPISKKPTLFLTLEMLSLTFIILDLVIRHFAFGRIFLYRGTCIHQRRESYFSLLMLLCVGWLAFGIVFERILHTKVNGRDKWPLIKIFRPLLIVSRDKTVQESIASKLFSVRIAVSLLIFMYVSYIIVSILLGLMIGVVITPEDSEPTRKGLFDGMDVSYTSTFRSVISMFISLSWGNVQEMSALIYGVGAFDRLGEQEVGTIIARFFAGILLACFIIFTYSADAIVVASCVKGFMEYKALRAKTIEDEEIKNLDAAFDSICASSGAGTENISKAMWLSILHVLEKRYGSSDDFSRAGILIFESIDTDNSGSLEKDEFISACVKAIMSNVRKIHIQDGSHWTDKVVKAFPRKAWEIFSIVFDTVGANMLWCFWTLFQFCFLYVLWTKLFTLSRLSLRVLTLCNYINIEDNLHGYDDGPSLYRSTMNHLYSADHYQLSPDFDFYDSVSGGGNSVWDAIPSQDLDVMFNSSISNYAFTGGLKIACNITDANAEDMNEDNSSLENLKTLVILDNIFVVLSLFEVILRLLTFQKRAKNYPMFSKRAIPRMETFDSILVVISLVLVLLDYFGDFEIGDSSGRLILCCRVFRLFRVFPSMTRITRSDTKLLLRKQSSTKKLGTRSFTRAMFQFKTRILLDYNPAKKNDAGKSAKGSFMRICQTFLYTFIFALRQFFLVFLIIYCFAAVAEYAFFWMPCTVQGGWFDLDQEELVDFGDKYYFTSKEENNQCEFVDETIGTLDINLIFNQLSSICLQLAWSFVSRDPQQLFAYMVGKANEENLREVASKKAIFTFFFVYYTFMITFQYNIITAELMQLCDLLRFNMLHKSEVVYLKPKGCPYVFSIEWRLDVNSIRGQMIMEYYNKKLSLQHEGDEIDEDNRETVISFASPREDSAKKRKIVKSVVEAMYAKVGRNFAKKKQSENLDDREEDDCFEMENPLKRTKEGIGSATSKTSKKFKKAAIKVKSGIGTVKNMKVYNLKPPTLAPGRKLPSGEVMFDVRRRQIESFEEELVEKEMFAEGEAKVTEGMGEQDAVSVAADVASKAYKRVSMKAKQALLEEEDDVWL